MFHGKASNCVILIIVIGLFGCKTDKGGVSGNTPPSVKEVKIYPDHPTSQTRAEVLVEISDPDNDKVSYTAQWYVNGKEAAEGSGFDCGGVKRDDRIQVEVTPYDGKEYGKPEKSQIAVAGNLTPTIVDAKLEPDMLFATTRTAKVNVTGTDADGDSLRYICRWYVADKQLPDSSISISNLSLKKGDRFTVDVLAYDGAAYSLGRVINGTIANSPPVVSAKTDSVMAPAANFSHSLAISDPDGDRLTYAMTSGPATVRIDPNTGVISGTIEQTSPIEIRATDTEGAYLDVRFTLTPARR